MCVSNRLRREDDEGSDGEDVNQRELFPSRILTSFPVMTTESTHRQRGHRYQKEDVEGSPNSPNISIARPLSDE